MGKNIIREIFILAIIVVLLTIIGISRSQSEECFHFKPNTPLEEVSPFIDKNACIIFDVKKEEKIIHSKVLERWMKDNLKYISEEKEYWKSPDETVEDGGGDCEDFAILVQDRLQQHNIKVKIIVIVWHTPDKPYNEAHAIGLFKDEDKDGTLNFFSNQNLYDTNQVFINNIMDKYFNNWHYFKECKPNRKCGKRIYNKNFKKGEKHGMS